MNGLLGNPQDAALLSLGLGLLQGAAPSPTPRPLGSILGGAGQNALQAYQSAANVALQQQQQESLTRLREAQVQETQAKLRAAEAARQREEVISSTVAPFLESGDYQGAAKAAASLPGGFKLGMELLGKAEDREDRKQARIEAAEAKREALELRRDAMLAQAKSAEEKAAFDKWYKGESLKLQQQLLALRGEKTEPLVSVMNNNGEAVYVPRSQAVGARVPPSSGNRTDTQTEKLSKQLQDVKAPQAFASINTLNNMLSNIPEGGEIPGMGYIKNTKIATPFLSNEGKDIKSSMQAVANDLLAMYSGMAVTLPEAERRELEEMRSGYFSQGDFKNAWPRIVNRFNSILGNVRAGYPSEAVDAYSGRVGAVPLSPITPAFQKAAKKPWERSY